MIHEIAMEQQNNSLPIIPNVGSVAPKAPLPRAAFLGWCDGFARVQIASTSLLRTNIIGLSEILISPIFPFSLRGNNAVFAIYRPEVGERLEFVFRDQSTATTFGIEMKLDSGEQIDLSGHTTPVPTGTIWPGWFLHGTPIESDVLVNQPGQYAVFQKSPDGEIYLGTTTFLHSQPPPLTPEEIVALRSDPFALKYVRIAYACAECKKSLQVYAGLERNANLEAEGWASAETLPDEFVCDCKKLRIELVYLKTGLHGLLRRRIAPIAGSMAAVRLYEASALEQKCRDFKKLLEKSGEEERLQKFLEKNPFFLSRFNPKRLMFKKPVLSKYFVDFAVVNERKELLLIEIENSSTVLLKKDGGVRSELQHALDQVRRWKQEFDDHRAAALDCLGLRLEDIVRVKGIVIAGRTPKSEQEARLLRSLTWPDVEFYTFDDLINGAAEIIRHVTVG